VDLYARTRIERTLNTFTAPVASLVVKTVRSSVEDQRAVSEAL